MEFLVYNKMDNSRSNIDEKPSNLHFKLSNGSLDVSGGRNAYVTRSCNGVIESIKVVVFSTKLNILIIFGPAAIVVDKTSDANGWVFLLSLLGIIPLAERLGFATERPAFFKGPTVASVNSGLLLMAVMALLFLAVLLATHTELHFEKSKLALSRFCSCAMLVAYAAYLYFQLKSQWQLFPEISKRESIIWLFILTNWISILSEYFVDAVEGASMELKMPVAFISIILLPIVGNAGAIMFTMKDKLPLKFTLSCAGPILGVAIGSSTQIVPFSIVIGRIMGRPIDLNLQLFETATLMITEENSNYFKGLMLVFCYVIVAASFLVLEDPTSLRKLFAPFAKDNQETNKEYYYRVKS
ncbi:vacuolar cation/proton exchanger 2 [Citrus sinensis]|nr:vacuolar cation/proton exchanger 2 [Citrus sinensis]